MKANGLKKVAKELFKAKTSKI